MNEGKISTKRSVVKHEGILKEIVTITDETGAILHKVIQPLKLEFHGKDIMQIIVGSMLLAIPVGFTEEVWVMSETLPRNNIVGIVIISLIFLSVFTYYNYYRGHLREHTGEFIKRTFSTYFISLIVVGLFLTVVSKAPWFLDTAVAIKRIIIVALPASMSAAVADTIK